LGFVGFKIKIFEKKIKQRVKKIIHKIAIFPLYKKKVLHIIKKHYIKKKNKKRYTQVTVYDHTKKKKKI